MWSSEYSAEGDNLQRNLPIFLSAGREHCWHVQFALHQDKKNTVLDVKLSDLFFGLVTYSLYFIT